MIAESNNDKKNAEKILLGFVNGSKTVTNWPVWFPGALSDLTIAYGKQASYLLKNNTKFVHTKTLEQSMPSGTFTPDLKASFERNFWKTRQTETDAMDANKEKLTFALINTLSAKSRELIKRHPLYDAAYNEGEPEVMWKIVREAHVTKIGGTSAGKKGLNKLDVTDQWAIFRMSAQMDLDDYFAKLKSWFEILATWEIDKYTDEQKGYIFIQRLDPVRYASLQAHFKNNSLVDSAYPDSMAAANEYAEGWSVSTTTKGSDGEEQRSFVLCKDMVPSAAPTATAGTAGGAPGSEKRTKRVKGDVRAGDENLTCYNCDEVGHVSVNCPKPRKKKAPSTGKQGGKARGRQAANTSAVADDDTAAAPAKGPMKGPTPPTRSGYIARGDRDPEDEEAAYDNAFSGRRTFVDDKGTVWHSFVSIASSEERARLPGVAEVWGVISLLWFALLCWVAAMWRRLTYSERDYELFDRAIRVSLLAREGYIEVIFDSAASHSLFNCAELLSDIVLKQRPYTMKGVERFSSGISVTQEGIFGDIGQVDYCKDAVACILSQADLVDRKLRVTYDTSTDEYRVEGNEYSWTFCRKVMSNGKRTRFYTHDVRVGRAFNMSVADNLMEYTVREQRQAAAATNLSVLLGHMTPDETASLLRNGGITNCPLTSIDVKNGQNIFGVASAASLKGRTKKHASAAATRELAPRSKRTEPQMLSVDIMFIKGLEFLVGVLSPLGLCLVSFVRDRSAPTIARALFAFIATARSRYFDVVRIHSDGEGAVHKMKDDLRNQGITVDICGPGQHVPVAERMVQTLKNRVRAHEHGLPYTMTRALLIGCVLFCGWAVNLQPSSTSVEKVSPHEKFGGIKLDYKRDLRAGFGQWCQVTVPSPDNTMAARTEGCVAMGNAGNSTGSVKMWCLETNQVLVRDQFVCLPMTSSTAAEITAMALREGLTRTGSGESINTVPNQPLQTAASYLGGGPAPAAVDEVRQREPAANLAEAGVVEIRAAETAVPAEDYGELRRSGRNNIGKTPARFSDHSFHSAKALALADASETSSALLQCLIHRANYHDEQFAFKMSVRAAMRDREEEARPVIIAELKQMIDKGVWHAVRTSSLSAAAQRAIIRSTMFLKDKWTASGLFEKFKARLVAGGDQQDKALYDNLSSPTAATSSVLSVAAIAAAEWRHVMVIDIGGAFLNADMKATGVIVHMRLDRLMTALLVELKPSYAPFVEASGCMVVALDKALYGCVEASALWFANLRDKLIADGFMQNPHDICIFNKFGADGKQITIALHVDDLLVTSASETALEALDQYLKDQYPETKTQRGEVVDYIGMSFDFRVRGEVSVTMENCTRDILSECGVTTTCPTPASSFLFDVSDDAPKANEEERVWFHSHVAKLLYLAKRVRPECLTAVSFLSTRVHECDVDDLAKLRRVLGYLTAEPNRGITLRVGENMTVSAYIDAAYGVHAESGKSHTGCAIVLGGAGPVFAKSAKQKIVTKSSTEAELVGLSDTASQAIHLRNFVLAQGYEVGPAVIHQDNMSCMALMKRGGATSERSRHISIRYFWLKERVDGKEVIVQHLGTSEMYANALTKPVQGAQFRLERGGLTNWNCVAKGLA